MSNVNERGTLLEIFQAALTVTHPRACVPPHVPELPDKGRLIVLGAGKAAAAMAQSVEETLSQRGVNLHSGHLAGTVATRHGYGLKTNLIGVTESGHPIPDRASVAAAETALHEASKAGSDDLVLVLLSGGASAIWSAPVDGISLEEQQDLTAGLLRSGMPIRSINAVRKHLSRIKGGRLVRAAHQAPVLTLAISDVPGDIPSAIGSGPTIGDETTLEEARAAIAEYGIELSDGLNNALHDPANETPGPDDEIFLHSRFELIATATHAVNAAADRAREAGYEPVILGDALEGEARLLAKEHARLALEIKSEGRSCALISGGECTVTVKGGGTGGPNQEYALALAIALDGAPGISALAADTDGADGGRGGKNDPAGAVITADTLRRAEMSHLNPAIFLENNDSSTFFRAIDDLIVLGPTHTNVNDIRIILTGP